MLVKVYAVKNWSSTFEKSQNKRAVEHMHWVAIPTKHDGMGFRRLMKRLDAGDVFAAFILMVEVAAKCHPRGVLVGDGKPLTPEDLELKTGMNSRLFDAALSVLSDPEHGIEWLEIRDGIPSVDSRSTGSRPHNRQTESTAQHSTAATRVSPPASRPSPATGTAAVDAAAAADAQELATRLGFPALDAAWAIAEHGMERTREAIQAMAERRKHEAIRNPNGLLRTMLAEGFSAPAAKGVRPPDPEELARRRELAKKREEDAKRRAFGWKESA